VFLPSGVLPAGDQTRPIVPLSHFAEEQKILFNLRCPFGRIENGEGSWNIITFTGGGALSNDAEDVPYGSSFGRLFQEFLIQLTMFIERPALLLHWTSSTFVKLRGARAVCATEKE
jgi:hypothetical protein